MVETIYIECFDGKVHQMWFIKVDGLTIWSTFIKQVAMKKIELCGMKEIEKND